MNTTTTSWRCHRCATTGTGDAALVWPVRPVPGRPAIPRPASPDRTPPAARPAAGRSARTAATPCPSSSPCPPRTDNPAMQQATALMIGYQARPDDEGMTGDEH